MLYWVGYDLDKPGQNYDAIVDLLERWGARRVLLSDWLLETSWTATEIYDALQATNNFDRNDRLIVAELVYNAKWSNLLAKDTQELFGRAAVRRS